MLDPAIAILFASIFVGVIYVSVRERYRNTPTPKRNGSVYKREFNEGFRI